VLELKGWTADPKSRKLRGFGPKTGAQLELFLNGSGLQVDSKETQGLFNKTARPKGYLLIWPLDLDLMALVEGVRWI
jgi:hypothetical protein